MRKRGTITHDEKRGAFASLFLGFSGFYSLQRSEIHDFRVLCKRFGKVGILCQNVFGHCGQSRAYVKAVEYLLQLAQEDETDLSVAKEATKSVATYIKSALSLADSVMSSLPFVKFDVDSILAACIPSDVDYENRQSVESAIERLEAQASQAKEQMKVTKEDEAAIRTMLAQSETVKAVDSARTALNEALDKAKSDARALLLSLKSARLA